MDDTVQALFDWLASVHDYAPIPWERLPELDLYMDQVITLMDKQLAPFQGEEERLLTSSMINNYVKGGVLPRPTQKKYARPHLAMLLMIVMLKPVLSLPEIQKAMKGLGCGKPHRGSLSGFYPAANGGAARGSRSGTDHAGKVGRGAGPYGHGAGA